MATAQADLEECPVDGCDAAVTIALVTTSPTRLKRQNLVHEAVCLKPTSHDGEPASYIVYHTDLTANGGAPEPDDDEGDEEDEVAPEEAPGPDPSELTGEHRIVYNKIVEATPSGGTVKLGVLKGKCLDADIPPSRVGEVAEELVERGYVIENTDAVYKPAR